MTKEQISTFLKQMRKSSGLLATDVASELETYGFTISPKTLYGYEGGISTPNADIFLALCRIYHCENPMELLGDTTIIPEESSLMEKIRSLSPHDLLIIRTLVDKMLDDKEHNYP